MEPIFAFDPRWAFAPTEAAESTGTPEVACRDAGDQRAAVRPLSSRHTIAPKRDGSAVVPIGLDEAFRYAERRRIVLGWFGVLPQAFGEIGDAGALGGVLMVARPRRASLNDGLTGEVRLILHDDESRRRPLLARAMALCRQAGMTRLVIGVRAGGGIDLDSMGFTASDSTRQDLEPQFSRVLRFGERLR
jgi:hypothetical protein